MQVCFVKQWSAGSAESRVEKDMVMTSKPPYVAIEMNKSQDISENVKQLCGPSRLGDSRWPAPRYVLTLADIKMKAPMVQGRGKGLAVA